MNFYRTLLMMMVFCLAHKVVKAQDSISVYIQNVDSLKKEGMASISEVINYPFVSLMDKSVSLEYKVPKKIKLASYKLTFNGDIYPVWEGDTINVIFNKQTGTAELSVENDNLLLFYSSLYRNFYKKYILPEQFVQENNPSINEFVHYTENYYYQKSKYIQSFFADKKKPLLRLILNEEIEYQKLYTYLESKYADSLIDNDSLCTLYKNRPTSLDKYSSNYYRLAISSLNIVLVRKDFSSFLSEDDFNQAFITTAQKYFSKEVAEFLVMLRLNILQKSPKDVNMKSAEIALNYLQHSSLSKQYKNTAIKFYNNYRKALKTLPSLLSAKLKTYNGKVVKLGDVVRVGTPVFMDFWATWCAPCIEEFPSLYKAAKTNKNVRFISLSIDENEDKWRQFIKARKLDTKNNFLLVGASKNLLADIYTLNNVPRFIVFNAKGKCVSSNFIRPSEPDFNITLRENLILKNNE